MLPRRSVTSEHPDWRQRWARWLTLSIMVGVAVVLRAYLDNSGIPGFAFERADERIYTATVIGYLNGHFDVHYFINPALLSYVLYAGSLATGTVLVWLGRFASLSAFIDAATFNPYAIIMTGRVLSVALGAASVWLVYRIGKRLFDTRVALLAAAALAANATHTIRSPLVTNETLMAFLVLVFFDCLVAAAERPSTWRRVGCGLWLGLAIAAKYNALVHLVTLAAAPWFWRRPWSSALPAFAAAAAGFAIGSPPAIIHPHEFVQHFTTQLGFLHHGYAAADASAGSGYRYYVLTFPLGNNGIGFALAALLGCLAMTWRALARREPRAVLLMAGILPAYLFLGSGVFHEMRFLLPAIVLLPLVAAWAIDRILGAAVAFAAARRGRAGPSAALLFVARSLAVASLLPVVVATQREMNRKFGRLDPRHDLLCWVEATLDPGARFVELAIPSHCSLLQSYAAFRTLAPGQRAPRQRTYDATPMDTLFARCATFAELERALAAYDYLLLVVPRHFTLLPGRVPDLVREPLIASCTYWNDLVAHCARLPHDRHSFSDDGTMMACLVTLRHP